jgi:hypothetical protein
MLRVLISPDMLQCQSEEPKGGALDPIKKKSQRINTDHMDLYHATIMFKEILRASTWNDGWKYR